MNNHDATNVKLIILLYVFTVPPDRLSVLNEKGDHIPHYILGPYKEGVTVDITCIASGGNVHDHEHDKSIRGRYN